ncbi:unnamed protein product [Prorocentrum cordatum]|uniref:Uncharacterized protein n=1 Tax=Prorocentrum cordatum TaxID=2364126 RepID=A0ABN9SYS3_9DINO|nr:unnamed protein product [Polarella glacialis]
MLVALFTGISDRAPARGVYLFRRAAGARPVGLHSPACQLDETAALQGRVPGEGRWRSSGGTPPVKTSGQLCNGGTSAQGALATSPMMPWPSLFRDPMAICTAVAVHRHHRRRLLSPDSACT